MFCGTLLGSRIEVAIRKSRHAIRIKHGTDVTTATPIDGVDGALQTLTGVARHDGVLWIYLNGRCNFSCSYCLDDRNALTGKFDARPDYIERLRELQSLLGYSLVLTGGEPMLSFRAVGEIYRAFAHAPKAIQTNGALTKRIGDVIPLCQRHDWFSISYHQETLDVPASARAVATSIAMLLEAGVNVHVQFMCSPRNITEMLEAAARHAALGCKVSLRRLFDYPPDAFARYRSQIAAANSDGWATDAFFLTKSVRAQPFKAAVVYLDGTIAMVCREEVKIGNLYTGYDLGLLEPHLGRPCTSVCHCCSCLWVDCEWGFS